jgi:hypothetical protein
MNNEQQELVYRAYDYYLTYLDDNQIFINSLDIDSFVKSCKKDSEDAKMWGLTFEERELSLEERWRLLQVSTNGATIPWDRMGYPPHEWMDNVRTIDSYDKDFNLIKGSDICTPRKIVTVTYNDKTIVSYK